MSDKFKYTAGLHNVGSYLVAGSPYVTSSVVEEDSEKQITFPRVTNNVTVKLDSGENLNSLHLSASNNDLSYFINDTSSAWNPSDGDSITLSVWISGSGQTTSVDNGMIFGHASDPANTAKFTLREKDKKIQIVTIDAAGATQLIFSAVVFPTDGWIHVAGVLANNRLELFINGASVGTDTGPFTTKGLHMYAPFQIGGSQNVEGSYKFRDAIIWNNALSDSQVNDLYQASASYNDPRFSPSGIAKLGWMKPTGSAGEVSPLINTLTNHGTVFGPWVIDGSGSGEIIEISSDSPFAGQGGTGGELRVHYRSTGSLPNVANRKHYWTLDAQDEEIRMNVKTKEIYLSAVGGDCDFSIHADLTNIPTARMYEHTGSGVDE